MVDTARHPSRRTVVKAGLWVAPAVAVVNLTSMSAAHASVATGSLEYPSHGFVVFVVETVVDGKAVKTYYAFKFGDASHSTVVGEWNQAKDGVFLKALYAPDTVIGNDAVGTTWDGLRLQIKVSTFDDSRGVGYVLTEKPAGFVGAYVFDGDVITPAIVSGGQYLFTKTK